MFKQAWRSYIASLHPRNYKSIKNLGFEIMWFWMIVYSSFSDHATENIEDRLFRILFWLTIILPYFTMWWSNLNHKLSMPKMMYFSPMKKAGRKEYLQTLLVIKIGFPTVVHIILYLILGMLYEMDALEFALSTFGVLSFGIGMYVCSELRSKFDRYIRYGVRGRDGTGKDAWLNWFCMIYAVLYRLFVMMVEVEGALSYKDWIWVLGFVAIMMVFDIAIIKTRYKETIEDICNYEEAYNVLGKVKNV